jgi:hypothetical protein
LIIITLVYGHNLLFLIIIWKPQPSGKRFDLFAKRKIWNYIFKFVSIVEHWGEIVISACYIDNDATRLKQEYSYRKMGMTIITDAEDSFTATKEKFWSQRFTQEKMLSYLSLLNRPKKYHSPYPDTYDYGCS